MSPTETAPSQPHETPSAWGGVAVAADDGVHLGAQADAALSGRRVTAIATDAAHDALWALVDRRELVRVADGSAEHVAALTEPVGVCVHDHGGQLFVGGDDAGLWMLDGRTFQPVSSFREAPTRPGWHTPWGGPPSVFSMASHGDDLYVSVHVGGIMRTSDGGRTWADTIDLHEDVHQVVVDPATGTVWAATGTSGLGESTDGGRTWRHHTAGLHATYLLAVAVTDAGVLVGASSGHAAKDGAVYLFDGNGFDRPGGLPASLHGAVGPRRLHGLGARAAVVTPDGDLHLSEDGGRAWHQAGGPFAGTAEVLVTAPIAG